MAAVQVNGTQWPCKQRKSTLPKPTARQDMRDSITNLLVNTVFVGLGVRVGPLVVQELAPATDTWAQHCDKQ